MNVTHQLPKINVFIAHDGMITILKQMPVPEMAKVVGYGISGEEPSHEFWKTRWAASQEQMGVIGHQRPRVDMGFRLFGKIAQAFNEVLPVPVIIHNLPFFNPADDDMVEGPGSIESRLSGHRTSFEV
jgi:hypothetical protein